MKKISKKSIRIRYIKEIFTSFNLNKDFIICSLDHIKDIKKIRLNNNIEVFKKSLYNYILPGIFYNSVTLYLKKHSFINYNIDLKTIINNKDIIIFKYKNFIFYNNLNILNKNKISLNFIDVKKIYNIKHLLLTCIFFI